MKELKFKILDKSGLHARPAGALSATAKSFECDIEIFCQDKTADAKRLLSLMSLGAVCGTELLIRFDGEDEKQAYEAIKTVCYEKLG